MSIRYRLDGAFVNCGQWRVDTEKPIPPPDLAKEAGVYAFVIDGRVAYIGKTNTTVSKRMYFYANPGSGQRTNLRINPMLKKAVAAGKKVELPVATPGMTSWNGLPVDPVPRLETGMIAKFRPPWNQRGQVAPSNMSAPAREGGGDCSAIVSDDEQPVDDRSIHAHAALSAPGSG